MKKKTLPRVKSPFPGATLKSIKAKESNHMNLVRHRTIPLTLFRIGPKRIKLRDYETQMAKKSRSYDIHIHPDGNVHPMDGVKFTKPNGK